MTVSYNLDVSSVSFLNFFKVIFRWRGSVWKSVWSELLIWLICYYIVMISYRNIPESTRLIIKEYIDPIDDQLDKAVPLTFMLAFFVSIIVDRWKNTFANMGFIENTALSIASVVRGEETEVVLARRTIIRYLVLSQVLVFRDISLRARRRFPNLEAIMKSGFIQEHEIVELEKVSCPYNKYWLPINWACSILHKLFADGKISAAPLYNAAWQEIKTYRTNMANLCNFDWVPIPLAYPQVIFVAVRFYFFMCLFGRQHLDLNEKKSIDYYFPILTVAQFIVYMGWMKVAEALLNPLGEDDDDFECNFLIDKNIATGMSIVDETFNKFPEMKKDMFAEPEFAPFYPEDVINNGADHALLGSAQTVTLADPSDIHPIDPLSPLIIGHQDSSTSTIRRRFSNVFRRSNSVRPNSPIRVEPDIPFSKSMAPQRPYGAFELSNGFIGANSRDQSQSYLPKLDEENEITLDEETLKKHMENAYKQNENGNESGAENMMHSPVLPFDRSFRKKKSFEKIKF